MIAELLRWIKGEQVEVQDRCAYWKARCEAAEAAHEAEQAKRRAEWEEQNELEKKIDACYLGTRHSAFYGTYEEWLVQHYTQQMTQQQLTQIAAQNAAQNAQTYCRSLGSYNQPFSFGLDALGGAALGGLLGQTYARK